MCAGCVSSFDSLAINGFGILAAASVVVERIRRRQAPDAGLERSRRAWERDAFLMRELGLEPAEVLGPKPGTHAPPQPAAQASEPICAGARA